MQKPAGTPILIFAVTFLCFGACVSHDLPDYTCTDTYSFSADIKPIIQTRCAISGCHNGDMGPNLNWNDFAQFHKRVESGLVKYRVTHRIMPPSYSPAGPLMQEQINAISCWADQGALNN